MQITYPIRRYVISAIDITCLNDLRYISDTRFIFRLLFLHCVVAVLLFIAWRLCTVKRCDISRLAARCVRVPCDSYKQNISANGINMFVFRIEVECVLSEVGTNSYVCNFVEQRQVYNNGTGICQALARSRQTEGTLNSKLFFPLLPVVRFCYVE
jgi:hypothetical protein